MSDALAFREQVVLVTGSSRGIGRAIADLFARRGASVAVHYRARKEEAERVLRAWPEAGHRAFAADVSDAGDCERLIAEVVTHYGRLDVLVNNAGIFESRPLKDLPYAEWQATWKRTVDANLIGPANLCFLAAQAMMKQHAGKIINISSRGAFRGEPDAPAYGAAKAGLNQLSQSLAVALAPWNIFVGVIAPGFVRTEMAAPMLEGPTGEAIRRQSPLGRAAEPEEVAEAVVRLAADGMMYATGCILDVNGASYLRT